MSFALLHADEETEPGVYGAYLRAQADADLLDILRHLDPERYPPGATRRGASCGGAACYKRPPTTRPRGPCVTSPWSPSLSPPPCSC